MDIGKITPSDLFIFSNLGGENLLPINKLGSGNGITKPLWFYRSPM